MRDVKGIPYEKKMDDTLNKKDYLGRKIFKKNHKNFHI